MTSNSYVYTFFGKVLPERANVTISPLPMDIQFFDAGIKGSIKLTISLSQIVVQFFSDSPIDNIYTLRNYIEDAIRVPIDALGYLLGCGYDIEITSMMNPSGQSVVFGVGITENIEAFKKNRPKDFPELIQLFSDENGRYLQLCLADLREAIRNTKDSGFFCYRAIESLTSFFAKKYRLKKSNKRKIWEKFREDLGVERKQIDFIQSFSDPVRHGDTIYISAENSQKILTYSWEIIDKYILFAANGYKKIS